jgi:hypothetical protein
VPSKRHQETPLGLKRQEFLLLGFSLIPGQPAYSDGIVGYQPDDRDSMKADWLEHREALRAYWYSRPEPRHYGFGHVKPVGPDGPPCWAECEFDDDVEER